MPGEEINAWREGIDTARQLARDAGMMPLPHPDQSSDDDNDGWFYCPFAHECNPIHNCQGDDHDNDDDDPDDDHTGNLDDDHTGNLDDDHTGNLEDDHTGNLDDDHTGNLDDDHTGNLDDDHTGNLDSDDDHW